MLTRELLREPGKFGLGQLPVVKAPDSTTGMVCGFCATGCNLNIHLRDGQAVNLTPATDYPVNLGMACPKGWEALTVLDATDRATIPLLKDADGVRRGVDWHTAMEAFTARFKAIQEKHGKDSVAFLSTGQIPSEEMALLGSLGEVRDGDGPRRRQHPAVHGHRRRGLQAVVRIRRAALHLPGFRGESDCSSWSARTFASPTRSCGSG